MAKIDLNNLRTIRQALDLSQTEFAALLGLSSRAIQSYEQDWREVPPYVQKLASLVLSARVVGKTVPCWKQRECPLPVRRECPAFRFMKGQFCWMVEGTPCSGPAEPWARKLARCKTCKVTEPWLNPAAD